VTHTYLSLSSTCPSPQLFKKGKSFPWHTPTCPSPRLRTGWKSWKELRRMTRMIRFWRTRPAAQLSVLNSRKEETQELSTSKDLSSALLRHDFFFYVMIVICYSYVMISSFNHHTVFVRTMTNILTTIPVFQGFLQLQGKQKHLW